MGRIIPTNTSHANTHTHTHTQSHAPTDRDAETDILNTKIPKQRQTLIEIQKKIWKNIWKYTDIHMGISGSTVAESHTLTDTDTHMGIRVTVVAR